MKFPYIICGVVMKNVPFCTFFISEGLFKHFSFLDGFLKMSLFDSSFAWKCPKRRLLSGHLQVYSCLLTT